MQLRTITSALAVGALALGGVAAEGEDEPFARIDDLSVTVAAGSVTITGQPVFGGPAYVAWEDAGGDSLAPAQGLDLLSGSISQDPATELLTFRMELGDLPAGDVQPGALYNWNLGVSGAEEQRLFAWRNNVLDNPGGGWTFEVITFGDSGFLSTIVDGQFTGDAIEWYLAPAQIAGKGGSKIGAGAGPMTASQGGMGPLQLTNFVDYDTATWSEADRFAIGGGVEVLIEGNGEEIEESARVRRGEFELTIDELPPGTYTMTITSEFANAVFEDVRQIRIP